MIPSLLFPGILVLLSSLLLAFLALILDAEAFWILKDWSLRQSVDAWLHQNGGYQVAHHAMTQLVILFLALACGTWGAWKGSRNIGAHGSGGEASLKRWILGVGAVALLIQLMVPACWSSDVFLYGMHGRMVRVHGANPLTESGADYSPVCVASDERWRIQTPGARCLTDNDCPEGSVCRADFYVERLRWSQHPAAYGPLAIGFFSLGYQIEVDPHGNALVFRIWSALCALIALWWIMRSWGLRPAILFGWSPVLWLASANGGHLEPFLVLGALGFVSLARSAHPASTAGLGLVTGLVGLIKLPLLVLAAPFFVAEYRNAGRRKTLIAGGLALLIVVLGYLAFWASVHPFSGFMAESTKSMRSLLHLIRVLGMQLFDGDPIQILRWGSILVVGSWGFIRLRATSSAEDALKSTLIIWLMASCFVFGVFHPWHLLPAFVLAVGLHDEDRLFKAWTYLAWTSPLWVFGAWIAFGTASFNGLHSSIIALGLFAPALYWALSPEARTDP